MAEKAGKRSATKADLLERKKARTAQIEIILDDELAAEYEAAVASLASANGDRPAAEKRVAALKEQLDEATVTATLRAVSAQRYDELVDEHPPTNEQIAAARKEGSPKPPWNGETFSVALIAESFAEPSMSVEDVQQLRGSLNRAEFIELFHLALEVNTLVRRVAELGKGSG